MTVQEQINEAAARCREAFKDSTVGDPVWCCHHEKLAEVLTEPAEARIQFILSSKLEREQVRRLNEFRLMKNKSAWAEYQKINQPAWAEYQKIEQSALAEYQKINQPALAVLEELHKQEYPDTKWDGKTIFGD